MKVEKVVLHEFHMGDVEDLEVYVAEPIYEWQQTEYGKWCMENAYDIHWEHHMSPSALGYRIVILGNLDTKNKLFWQIQRGETR
jgi:hypothetical protein